MQPKFSIAIPVYNRADYLRMAIKSCIAQTVGSLEIIVSDDCSTDNLAEVAASFSDKRIKYFKNVIRLGGVENHQRAVSHATGSYVITLNSDDLLLPDCLGRAGRSLDDCPNASAVYFPCAHLAGSDVRNFNLMPRIPFADRETLQHCSWLENFHGTTPSCCLFRKEAFDRLGGYRTSLKMAYDWDLYMRFMVRAGGVIFLPEILCIYRTHDEQMVKLDSINGLWDMLYLWKLREYSHFRTSEIAGLVLSQLVETIRKERNLTRVPHLWRQVSERTNVYKIILVLPWIVLKKAFQRYRGPKQNDRNYINPVNAESALEAARNAVASFGNLTQTRILSNP